MKPVRSQRKRMAGASDVTRPPADRGGRQSDEAAVLGEHVERGERPMAVYRYLQDLIVRGRLAPGSPLVETDIAGRLRVSRTPVRVALHRLHQQGFIVGAAGARLFKFAVAPLTREDAQALYHIVAELDGLAAHYAASIPDGARRQLVQSLRTLNDELRAAASVSRPDDSRIYELDHVFHRQYLESAANPRLLALHGAVKPQVERYSRVYAMLLTDEIHTSVREHDAIIQGLAGGDPDAAQHAARTNWRNAAERLARAIARRGEWGRW